MRLMYDAAYPPPPPAGTDIVAGYLGGDTPHVWSASEWASNGRRWRLGIWTRSDPSGAAQGATEGALAASAWRGLGAPLGTTIALDYETAVNADYVYAFDSAVQARGFQTLLYGSLSTVFGNPEPSAGYWTAIYDDQQALQPAGDARVKATQYFSTTDYDLSVVTDDLKLWDTAPAVRMEDPMYVALPLNQQVVLTNPAAVHGGTTAFCLSADFGDGQVRVAQFSFTKKAWDSVQTLAVNRAGAAVRLDLGGDVNKVSFQLTGGTPGAVVSLTVV